MGSNAGSTLYKLCKLLKLSESPFLVKANKRNLDYGELSTNYSHSKETQLGLRSFMRKETEEENNSKGNKPVFHSTRPKRDG